MLWGSMLQHAALWRESPLDLGGDEDQATLMWQQCCVYPRTQEFEDHLINIVWVTREGCHHLWNTLGQDIKAIIGQTAATQEAQEMMIWVFRKNLSDCQKPATAFEAISQLTPPPPPPTSPQDAIYGTFHNPHTHTLVHAQRHPSHVYNPFKLPNLVPVTQWKAWLVWGEPSTWLPLSKDLPSSGLLHSSRFPSFFYITMLLNVFWYRLLWICSGFLISPSCMRWTINHLAAGIYVVSFPTRALVSKHTIHSTWSHHILVWGGGHFFDPFFNLCHGVIEMVCWGER